jgi:apolipoprotein N-acyltransferase
MKDDPPASGSLALLNSRLSSLVSRFSFLVAFVLGAVTVAGYAPFHMFPLPVVTLAGVFYLWSQAGSPRAAAFTGFAFGLGLLLFGASWVYVSLHDFGAMPAALATIATFLFCAIYALCPAAAGYLCVRLHAPHAVRYAMVAPAAWTLAEWTRGWLFTGFPWLATGYSQVPASPLAGYAPVLGICGVTLAVALTSGLIVVLAQRATGRNAGGAFLAPAVILVVLWAGGWALGQIAWTTPVGAPFNASLLQGNVAQDLKWRAERVRPTLETYRLLAESAPGSLIILPETALPLFLSQVPQDYLDALAASARRQGGDLLVGVPEREAGGAYSRWEPRRSRFIASPTWCHSASSFLCGRCWAGSSACSPSRCRTSRAVPRISGRSPWRASALRSTSATRTRSARKSSVNCRKRRCW